MNDASNRKIVEVYAAVRDCTRALPFALGEEKAVSLVHAFSVLYSRFNEPPRYGQYPEVQAYLARHSAEEIAGHVLLYTLEWFNCP